MAAASNNDRVTIAVGASHSVSGLFTRPQSARALFVLAHGAGAGMEHPTMQAVAAGLAQRGVATLRYQFPYMERKSRRPDPPALCHATVRAAVAEAARLAPDLPLFAGGRSFGGRMTSQAQAQTALERVRGLAFLAFPLHPAERPGTDRATHLQQVQIPMLFIQGTRDELADLSLLRPVVAGLGARARLHLLEDADHSFHVPARTGRKDCEVQADALDTLCSWLEIAKLRCA
ncbi:MAG TPA: alpha/beta family hydrolase [Steroidobacteraceae bacterium]|nr:alpha/beta family hydrolase [Steroidobacteraceae bacterium]